MTLAQLKRDAQSGKLSAKMVLRCGGTNIPETMQGYRKVIDSKTNCIVFQNADGKRSELPIDCASLLEYNDTHINIYLPGLRDLNEAETAAMAELQAIHNTDEYKKQSNIDALTDGSCTFYQDKVFWEKRNMEYMRGFDTKQGKKFDFKSGKVFDNQIKGMLYMKYEVKI